MICSPLGTSGITVSRLGLGTVQLGMPYGLDGAAPPEDQECIALIRRAVDAGIQFIDTAAAYGRSEMLVGKACAGLPNPPVICTKVTLPSTQDGPQLIAHIEEQLEQSRRLLALDQLPLVMLHSQQGPFTHPALFEALEIFCARGWVCQWGVSTYGTVAPLHALEFPTVFAALQVPFNVLDRQCEQLLFPRAAACGTGIVVRSIFLQGILGERFPQLPSALAPLVEAVQALVQLADQAGLSLAELAFRFAAFHPGLQIALFGTTSQTELSANLQYFEAGPLPADLLTRLKEITLSETRLLNPSTWPSPT